MAWNSGIRGAALSLGLSLGLSLVLATSVTACGNRTEAPPPIAGEAGRATEALFTEALKRPSSADTKGLDLEFAKGFFSEWGELAYASAGADPDTGAYRLSDVSLRLNEAGENSILTAREVLLWNLDVEAIEARADGRLLDQTLRIFDRIEIGDLTLSIATDDLEVAADTETGPFRMTVEADRIALGGLTLHPWLYTAPEDASEDVRDLSLAAAVARNFSLDTALLVDGVTTQASDAPQARMSAQAVYPRQLLHGYDRGNIGAMVQSDATFAMDMTMPAETGAPPVSFAMNGSVAHTAWTGIRLENLLSWGEKGELPPITGLNDWSLGQYLVEDAGFSFGETPVFELSRLEASADQFSWFFPEQINLSYDGFKLNLSAMMTAMDSFIGAMPEAEANPSALEVAGMLDRAGLGTLAADGKLAFAWNRDTGQTVGEGQTATAGLFEEDWRLELGLPAFAELTPHFGEDGRTPDEDALDNLFKERLSLVSGHWTLADAGGFDAISKLVIELARAFGGQEPMLAGFAEGTPESVRSFAAGAVVMGSGSAAKEFPPARDWMMRFSEFIAQGGTFTLRMAPEEPVTAERAAALEAGGGMVETNPAAFIGLLGITVTHTPPPATP